MRPDEIIEEGDDVWRVGDGVYVGTVVNPYFIGKPVSSFSVYNFYKLSKNDRKFKEYLEGKESKQ